MGAHCINDCDHVNRVLVKLPDHSTNIRDVAVTGTGPNVVIYSEHSGVVHEVRIVQWENLALQAKLCVAAVVRGYRLTVVRLFLDGGNYVGTDALLLLLRKRKWSPAAG